MFIGSVVDSEHLHKYDEDEEEKIVTGVIINLKLIRDL